MRSRSPEPVLPGELPRVADPHSPLLGRPDHEEAAERPEGLAAERRLGLLVEQDHPLAGVRQLRGGHEPCETGSDHDRVGVHGRDPNWGDEDHVRSLFRNRVDSLDTERRTYVERAPTPAVYRRLFDETFGPLIALRAALAENPDRAAALDRDFTEFAERENVGEAEAEYVYEYLLVLARTRA